MRDNFREPHFPHLFLFPFWLQFVHDLRHARVLQYILNHLSAQEPPALKGAVEIRRQGDELGVCGSGVFDLGH